MKDKIILSTIPSDSHCWNLIFMELFLKEQGYEVINLGPCTPYDLILKYTKDSTILAIVVSTVNGHGYIQGEELIGFLRQHISQSIPIFIGGKLNTDINKSRFYGQKLENAGFLKSYSEKDDLLDLVSRLEELSLLKAEMQKHKASKSPSTTV